MHDLRVNEIKLTSGNAFIVDFFPFGINKESTYGKQTLFLWLPWEFRSVV